ncbi:MAG: VanW family protein [Selenomonadales bacterium]|nr:VanW family protein [Selenomonadales bacterium]
MGKTKWKKIAALIVAAAVLIFGGICAILLPSSERIVDGLHIGDVAIGGMTQEEAKAELTKACRQAEKSDAVLELAENDQKIWKVKASEFDFSVDVDATVERAYKIGREGHLFACLADAYDARSRMDMVSYAVRYNEEKLKGIINHIRDQIEVKPIEASAEVVYGKVVIHPNQTGYLVDTDAVLADVKQFGSQLPYRVSLHTKTIYAKVTTEALADIKDVLGIYTTRFSTAAVGRTHNIRLSASAINGLLMKPNDVFSFNEVVGYRSAERGYQEAPVIVDGKMEPGIGGGICQVSTTLYNAVLLANLGVIERECHYFPATYVPIGLDATVDYGTIDFRFRNSRQSDIYLWLHVEGNEITVAVLGNKAKEPVPNIRYYSEIEKVIPMEIVRVDDASVPAGQEIVKEKGNEGYISATYRVENGEYRLAYRDSYPATRRVIHVGPKKVEQKAVEARTNRQAAGNNALPPRPTTERANNL